MSKKSSILTLILSLVLLISVIAVTYSFFISNSNDYDSSNFGAASANIGITYTDCVMGYDHCQNITAGSMRPGDSVEKTFQVKNNGNVPLSYTLTFENLINTFQNSELVYKLENITNTNNVKVLYEKRVVPYAETSVFGKDLLFYDTVTVNSTNKYKMTITFANSEYDQSYNMGATFTFNIGISGVKELDTLKVQNYTISGSVVAINDNDVFGNTNILRSEVYKIHIVNHKNISESAIEAWDVSSKQNGSIMAWYIDSPNKPDNWEPTNCYELYIGQNGVVVANSNSIGLFGYFTNAVEINGLDYLNTSQITNMLGMFRGCKSIITLNLNNWDTSNNSSMHTMFYECENLTTLYINIDTSKVVTMYNTFFGCINLSTIELSTWDTTNVSNMSGMFLLCASIKTINLSNFNTSNVKDMSKMFQGSGIETINLNFDTTSVTSMERMFSNYGSIGGKLKSIDFGNKFNTTNLTKVNEMFYGCSQLTEINFGDKIVNDKITNTANIFYGCNKLNKITINYSAKDFITSILTDAGILNNVTIVTI